MPTPPLDADALWQLRAALSDLEFPQTTSELRRRVGSWRRGHADAGFEPLAHYLEGVPERTFLSPDEVTAAVERTRRPSSP